MGISLGNVARGAAVLMVLAGAADAQEAATPGDFADRYASRVGGADQNGKGPVTNLPLPRYVSLKGNEGNARRGPSLSHRIDWVFRHEGMPLRITAEFGHWRRVEDREGAGGWVHYTLLSGVRNVTVTENMTGFHARADINSEVVARAEAGVIAKLGECSIDWCRISAGGARGWVPKSVIWGVDSDEVRD